MPKSWIIGAALLLTLGACGSGKHGDEDVTVRVKSDTRTNGRTTTTTTTRTHDGDAAVGVTSDETPGNIRIDTPGFKLDVDVPASLADSAKFDIDGVGLYPGSKVRAMKVATHADESSVHIAFVSPADPMTVRGWIMAQFARKGHAVTGEGMRISGKEEDGKPFTITLAQAPKGQTAGDIAMQSVKSSD